MFAMQTQIFYFSGTGNSLKVARDLAQGLGETELIPIPQALKQPPQATADRIGLVFPVYMFGLPLLVAEFCRRFEPSASATLFAVATCGGLAAGTLDQLRTLLGQRGLALSAGFVVTMPGNYIPLYGAQSAARQQKLFAAAKERVAGIVRTIQSGQPARVEAGTWFGRALGGWIYRHGSARIRASDRKFWVTDRCDSCGVCRRVCPVDNIVMTEGRPVWQHHCEQCVACLQWCPREAIQFGRRTEHRKRYRHPEATAKDFMLGAAS